MKQSTIALAILLSAGTAFAQHMPHEHGVAELRVAIAGNTLQIEFESPLDNLVGFEHAPHTDGERMALAQAVVTLQGVERIVTLPAKAACAVVRTELEQPFADPSAGDEDGHAEISVVHTLQCATPSALTGLEVRLFEQFPRIREIRAERASPRGQVAAKLTPKQRMLSL
jgi:hypothetical protein